MIIDETRRKNENSFLTRSMNQRHSLAITSTKPTFDTAINYIGLLWPINKKKLLKKSNKMSIFHGIMGEHVISGDEAKF